MANVVLKGIDKRWGGFVGVKSLSLEVKEGEFMVFLGPSGCGKTTTMRMIAGLEDPTDGEVHIGGRMVNDLPPGDRDLAMVFQNYGLYPHMTVAENIGYPLKCRRVSKNERMPRVMAAAKRVELDTLLDRKPAALSGGQRQRVALARAIVRTPQLFLMDEPLSNLDAKLRISMRAQLKHLQRELGVTTIYVTHDQVEAMTLADRVVVLSKGELQQIDTPLNIYNRPCNTFVAGFLGSPPMNLISCEVDGKVLRHERFALEGTFQYRGKATLGQRPEDLSIAPAAEADFTAEAYTTELLGDSVLVTVRLGDALLAVKAPKDCSSRMGDTVGVRFSRQSVHLFDSEGARLPDPVLV